MYMLQDSPFLIRRNRLLLFSQGDLTSKAALAQVILDGTLLGSSRLCESDGPAERSCKSGVLELSDTDTRCTGNSAGAGHTGWHLDGDGEVHCCCSGETTDTDAWYVLGDGCGLEGGWVSSAGCAIDAGGERTGTILVDLVEGHGDGSVIS
jgi:hypothetical protein